MAIAATLGACGRGDGARGSSSASSSRPAAAAVASPVRFEDVTAAAGIRFSHVFGGAAFDNIVKSVGGGVAVLDYDGDGWMDLYFVNGGADPEITGDWKPAQTPRAALYRNRHDGTFEDVTRRPGWATRARTGSGPRPPTSTGTAAPTSTSATTGRTASTTTAATGPSRT